MNYYTAYVVATIKGTPKIKNIGKGKTPVGSIDIDHCMADEILSPEVLDTEGFYNNHSTTEPAAAAVWIEKTCKAQFVIANIEANSIADVEEILASAFNLNKNSSKITDLEITELKKQQEYI